MKKKKRLLSKNILVAYIGFFLVLAINKLISRNLASFDAFVALGFCMFFFFFERKRGMHPFIAFLSGLILLPHIIGNMGLYAWEGLNYHYDWIVHASSALFSTIVITYMLLKSKLSRKFLYAALLALSLTITFGAVIEVSEYWGFRFIGFGEGYLGFGEGDNSKNFGPWENSSVDTTLNFLGSLLGIIFYGGFLFLERRNKGS